MEIWKDITGYEGLYKVSNTGKIFSVRADRMLTIYVGRDYLRVMLCKKMKRTNATIGRLVATAFVPNPNNYPFVNHEDGDKFNNNAHNLTWCTHSMNMRHAKASGLRRPAGQKSKWNRLDAATALKIRKLKGKISYSEISKKYGVHFSVVASVIQEKSWKNI